MDKEKITKLLKFKQDPNFAIFSELLEITNELKKELFKTSEELKKKIEEAEIEIEVNRELIKGDKGDSIVGPKGDSPTEEELLKLIIPLIPEAKDGYTPIKGIDYFDGKDGQSIIGPKGDSIVGPVGPEGPMGPVPKHQWMGTSLRFENPDGTWGPWVNLKGSDGDSKQYKSGSGGGGYPVKTYDFSAALNGVDKTFTIPKNKYVIDVKIGTIPPLRPTVDYTFNSTSITFTSEIDASTYLSSGLSAIVIYAED